MTKTEQFRMLESEIREYKASVIGDYAQVKALYELYVTKDHKYFAKKWDVAKVGVIFDGHFQPSIKKRASEQDLLALSNYFDAIKGKVGEIIFICEIIDNIGHHSVGVTLDSVDDKYWSFTEEGLSAEIERKNREYEEFYKPREGYTACSYCRKQVPNDKIVMRTIIGRAWDNRSGKQVVTSVSLPFCSDKCAYNEQCAREG